MKKKKRGKIIELFYLKRLVCIVLISFCLFITMNTKAYAAESASKKGATLFTVEALLPENQVDSNKGYFYLQVKPGEEQELQVKISSTQKEEAKINIAVTDAVTDNAGQMVTSIAKPILDPTLKNPITSLVSVEEESKVVSVKNYEEKIVTLKLKTPKEEFKGIKTGAIRFIQEPDKKQKQAVEEAYGYSIGLTLTEDLEENNRYGKLELQKVEAKLDNGNKVVAATLQNPEPQVIDDLSIKAEITEKGSPQIVKQVLVKDMRVAPNSRFDFLVPWGIENFKPGSYTIKIQATSLRDDWKWTSDFEIDNKRADKLNQEAAFKVKLPRGFVVIAAVLFILLLMSITYILVRDSNWKKTIRARKRKKSKSKSRSKSKTKKHSKSSE